MQVQSSNKQWHFHNWGTWGWIETAVKSVGIAAGLVAFTMTSPANPMQIAGLPHIAAMVLLGILLLLLVFALVMRISQREVTSFVFAVANLLGHAGLLFYLVRTPDAVALPVIFGAAYIIGEGVKQQFLTVTGYTENGMQTGQILTFVRGLMVIYIVFTVLILV